MTWLHPTSSQWWRLFLSNCQSFIQRTLSWFLWAEMQFSICSVTQDVTKFWQVISALDAETSSHNSRVISRAKSSENTRPSRTIWFGPTHLPIGRVLNPSLLWLTWGTGNFSFSQLASYIVGRVWSWDLSAESVSVGFTILCPGWVGRQWPPWLGEPWWPEGWNHGSYELPGSPHLLSLSTWKSVNWWWLWELTWCLQTLPLWWPASNCNLPAFFRSSVLFPQEGPDSAD